jgi:hypothetical protein
VRGTYVFAHGVGAKKRWMLFSGWGYRNRVSTRLRACRWGDGNWVGKGAGIGGRSVESRRRSSPPSSAHQPNWHRSGNGTLASAAGPQSSNKHPQSPLQQSHAKQSTGITTGARARNHCGVAKVVATPMLMTDDWRLYFLQQRGGAYPNCSKMIPASGVGWSPRTVVRS